MQFEEILGKISRLPLDVRYQRGWPRAGKGGVCCGGGGVQVSGGTGGMFPHDARSALVCVPLPECSAGVSVSAVAQWVSVVWNG